MPRQLKLSARDMIRIPTPAQLNEQYTQKFKGIHIHHPDFFYNTASRTFRKKMIAARIKVLEEMAKSMPAEQR